MSDTEPIASGPRRGGPSLSIAAPARTSPTGAGAAAVFDRREFETILRVYGRMVAAGEWRDYAIDILKDRSVFSVFRRSSEVPLFRIVKEPKLARRQGSYAVVTGAGLVLKRGHDLARVLAAIDARQPGPTLARG